VGDPKVQKFPGLSPYAYTADNPILLTDPNGKDWTITMQQNKDGSLTYNIKFKAQVYNNTKNPYDTKKLASQIEKGYNLHLM
jgi:hypothetical protein